MFSCGYNFMTYGGCLTAHNRSTHRILGRTYAGNSANGFGSKRKRTYSHNGNNLCRPVIKLFSHYPVSENEGVSSTAHIAPVKNRLEGDFYHAGITSSSSARNSCRIGSSLFSISSIVPKKCAFPACRKTTRSASFFANRMSCVTTMLVR